VVAADADNVDVYEITRLVTAVTASSPLAPGPFDGYSNGKSSFFAEDQVSAIAAALPPGQVHRRQGGGWQEVAPDKGVRVLAQRHIDGGKFYRFRQHWGFQPVTG
jgi:hypothetical protein